MTERIGAAETFYRACERALPRPVCENRPFGEIPDGQHADRKPVFPLAFFRFSLFLSVSFCSLPFLSVPSAASAAEARWDARIVSIKGHVMLGCPGKKPFKAKIGFPLRAGDVVMTGHDGVAEIDFNGKSLLKLGADSDFVIKDSREPSTLMKLLHGFLTVKFAPLKPDQSIQLETMAAIASVRGTEFAVEAGTGTKAITRVGVFDEGVVEVKGQKGPAERLTVHQETNVFPAAAPAAPQPLAYFAQTEKEMDAFRRESEQIAAQWQELSLEQRDALRGQMLQSVEKLRQLNENNLNKIQQLQKPIQNPKDEKKDEEQMNQFERENAPSGGNQPQP